MLRKQCRITQNEFKRFIRKSSFQKNDIFYIRYAPNHKQYSQFATVVSLKVSKLATKRNRVKRLVSSWIYEKIDTLPKGLYIAVYINKIIDEAQKEDKKNILTKLLSRLR